MNAKRAKIIGMALVDVFVILWFVSSSPSASITIDDNVPTDLSSHDSTIKLTKIVIGKTNIEVHLGNKQHSFGWQETGTLLNLLSQHEVVDLLVTPKHKDTQVNLTKLNELRKLLEHNNHVVYM